MWKIFHRSISSLSNDLVRKRLKIYLEKKNYIDELSQSLPRIKSNRKASILLPIYCNEITNRVEILLLKRSDKVRSHAGMIVFPGGIQDLTDRDAIHTAERETEEEIGLKSTSYSILGCLPPITDSRAVMITPVVALLHSQKFMKFHLAIDEVADAFYLDLEPFLYRKNNYKMFEVGDHFVTHHFDIDKYHIWGVTAFEIIVLATIIFQKLPEFPFFRHGQQLNLKLLTEQLKIHFQWCVDYRKKSEIKSELDGINRMQ
ncbi:hypothetical protein I4U23_023658 [Adineta vaga]|nr:hypothetical protein I4U23_023658 [Adineta vaga]